MRAMPRLLSLAMTILLCSATVFVAQEDRSPELWRVGGSAGFGTLDYNADFSSLPEVPSCCPGYEDGSGTAFVFGASFELPLDRAVIFNSRLLFARFSGTLEADEQKLVTRDFDTVRATFRHTLDLAQPALLFEELIGYTPIEQLYILGGIRAEFMVGGTFSQREEIVSPDGIRYENDTRERLLLDGDIPLEKQGNVSFLLGLRYDLPLNHKGDLILSPELLYWHGMSDLVSSRDLTMSGFRVGVSMSWVRLRSDDGPSPLGPGE